MLVRSVHTSHSAIFRICGNESEPCLQLFEKLAKPLKSHDQQSSALISATVITLEKTAGLSQNIGQTLCLL